ncbi:MAG: NADH-quinone oxidoreductase subunit NuoF [candidate division NC10 bacterium]|nr:NADH-quinone oxidoreductase subunit NuoF [candidate division NC10 bacterium]
MLSETTKAKIETIAERYPAERRRSALIPAMLLVQEEQGYLSPEMVVELADLFHLHPTQVMEVASFYDLLHLKPAGRYRILVCHNLSCSLLGAEDLIAHFERRLGIRAGETTPDNLFTLIRAECLASCGTAPVLQVNGACYENMTGKKVDQLLDHLQNMGGVEYKEGEGWTPAEVPSEKILTKHMDLPGYTGSLEGYRRQGGYQALQKALKDYKPDEVIEIVKRSGLRGRGGAGFPAGVKWGFVPKDSSKPKYLVCNADESEPGTFKDRMLIEKDPHQLIEGIIISAYAVMAQTAYIYIRGEFAYGFKVLERALKEASNAGFLGKNILGSGFDLDIHLHRGAGAYICGEETGLLQSLEGDRGEPRLRPPFPATHGLYGCPTVVNNVETLANVPHIILRGAEWYASIGTGRSKGTRVFSVSGHVRRPGNYELPINISIRELIEVAGGIREGRRLKAVIPGGSSAPCLTDEHLDVRMDFESLAAAGSMGGSGAVIVMDDSTCMVRVAEVVARFYRHESCGQCTQCREGTAWLHKILKRWEEGKGFKDEIDVMLDICDNMKGETICVLSDACAMPVESYIRCFRDEFEEHVRQRGCPFRQ